MEQNIKNFDRGVEQMMNEHEVAPPFGMWNRISAELEAMPVAAAAPVVTSLIPKRAILGIIATALVLGTAAITGYLVNSSVNNKTNANTASVNTQIASPTVAASTPQQTAPVKNDMVPAKPAHAKSTVHHTVAANPVQSTLQAALQVKPTINQPTAVEPNTITLNNANTDVPTPIEPVVQTAVTETQTYYFPPIDVTTPEKNTTANQAPLVTKNHGKIAATTADNDDKGNTPSEHKWRIKRHKNGGWGWGKINTTK